MNSRGSEETNLVNFTRDLTTSNQLEAKETLISFPFDHQYARHADGPVRQTIQLDKEAEISTQCNVSTEKEIVVDNNAEIEINQLRDRLKYLEGQNKRLKDLVLFHLDFIQQQKESITKTEKTNQSLKEENETLKSKLIRVDKKLHLHTPKPVTSTVVNSEPNQQVMLNSFKELLLPPKKPSPFISFDGDVKNKKKNKREPYRRSKSTDTGVSNFPKNDHNILDTSNINSNLKMIENKRTAAKKETKPKKRTEPLYTITSTSGDPVIKKIQRNKRRTSTCTTANKEVTDPKPLEDPYLIGEAQMRERSSEMKFCKVDTLVPQKDTDLDTMKTETEIDASLCDYTFTETSLDSISFQDLFGGDALLDFDPLDYLSLTMTEDKEEGPSVKNKGQSKRGRKRASSTTGIGKLKNEKAPPKPMAPRGRAANRRKRLSPVPGLETKNNDSCCFCPVNVIKDMYKYKYPTTEVEDCHLAVAKTHHR